MTRVYEEFVDFIAHGPTTEDVLKFEPSEQAKAHVFDLVNREKRGEVTSDERAELDYFLHIEHLMRLAKARARRLATP